MRDNRTAYKIWAPDGALWTQWAKPVLFAGGVGSPIAFRELPDARWAPYPESRAALIVDMPGAGGVMEGLALARQGYRPVPLYNGVCGMALRGICVDVSGIVGALLWGCDVLERLPIRPDAPPVFLLDSNRMDDLPRQPGKYDNRWCVFPQDMPSAAFLEARGIREVHVRCAFIANDLAHILRRYKEKGILIYHVDESETARKIEPVRPSYFRSLRYRARTMAGLTRNAAGGFGGFIPEPSQASGGRYYGIG